jgi:hypothetical protein
MTHSTTSRKIRLASVLGELDVWSHYAATDNDITISRIREEVGRYFCKNYAEDPIDGTNFDCEVLNALKSNTTEEAREKLLALKEKYKDE